MLSTRHKFAIGGTVFGLCFPVVSTLIACNTRQVQNGCIHLHLEEPLLLVIDTAPFILGLFAYLIGRSIEGRIAQERAAQEAIRLREVEQRAAAERLAQQNKDLTELNEMLDGLVYTASHDLKTPVINFQSMLKMLRSIKDKPDSGPMVDNIIRRMEMATFRFQDTISGLLDISRVERLGDDLPMAPIDLQALVTSIWESIDSFAESKGASLIWGRIEVPTLTTNQEALQSVLLNLLTNALKYSDPQRPCVVEISTQSRPGMTTIQVKDNGIGIDMATHGHKLFRMFKRLTSQGEGSGIGLYIVRRTLQKLDAEIRVESQLGQGSTFFIDFPTHTI
jgi:signal transduction histidine kinase